MVGLIASRNLTWRSPSVQCPEAFLDVDAKLRLSLRNNLIGYRGAAGRTGEVVLQHALY